MAGDEDTELRTPQQSQPSEAQLAYSQLQILISQREDIFARVQSLADRIKKDISPATVDQFQFRMDRIVELQGKMDTIRQDILKFNPKVPDKNKVPTDAVQNSFEDLIDSIQVIYLKNKSKGLSSKTESRSTENGGKAQVRLPKLDLPKFSGKITEWSVFHNLFEASINKSTSLSNIEKFQYLLAKLDGEARQLVGTLELTGDNYAAAWEALCLRYNNDRRHIHYHLNSLLELPDVQQNTTLPALLCKISEHMNALTALKIEKNSYSIMLTAVIIRKLSFGLRRRFEDNREDSKPYPTFKELEEFLQSECSQIDNYTTRSNTDSQFKNSPSKSGPSRNFVTTKSKDRTLTCVLCSGNHPLYWCEDFRKLPIESRASKIKQWNRCPNCLANTHSDVRSCKSKYTCNLCRQPHHTLLHPQEKSFVTTESAETETKDQDTSVNCMNVNLSSLETRGKDHTILLGTALVGLKLPNGHFETVRAVIDSAAMSTFITKNCANRLGLKINEYQSEVSGLGNQSLKFWGDTEISIKPLRSYRPVLTTKAEVLTTITDQLPTRATTPEVLQRWQHLELADPNYGKPADIDLLIGAELFSYIYTGNKILTEDHCCALESIYGWVITGKFKNLTKDPTKRKAFLTTTHDAELNRMLKRLWEVEEPETCNAQNPEDEKCEEMFQKFHYREPSGRYVVPLPLKTPDPVLPNSHQLAEKRLYSVERKMRKNPEVKEAYLKFMREYEELGHMEQTTIENPGAYYIPHQCVNSAGKFRVVFDASMKTSNGLSLNSVLYTGPKLQASIVDILIRMRTHKVVMVADIAKMFRQIIIRPEDRKFQHILWRESENEPIKDYVLNTVTYGTGPAPYLSNRTLKQMAKDERENFPDACESIEDDIYVDDWIFGDSSISKIIPKRNQAIQLANSGGFELKKWSSNEPSALEGIDSADMAIPLDFEQEPGDSHGVLGVRWTPKTDTYSYKPIEFSKTLTKRAIVSNMARIFDPLGWIMPCILTARILVQKLWISGVGWDDNIPKELGEYWLKLLSELPLLTSLKIPRFITNPNTDLITLVGFSDGSQSGYGAVIYIVTFFDGQFDSNLLIAKSKVAPVKPLSVPRLELCGALLLARLYATTVKALEKTKFKIEHCVALSDSTTVLSWLTTPAYKLNTYVANRVVKITDILPSDQWQHVSSEDNSADLASRATFPSQLVNNPLWWKGPSWLKKDPKSWKVTPILPLKSDEIPEMKTEKIGLVSVEREATFMDKFSSFARLRSATAWCLRLFSNQHKKKNGETRITGELTADEINSATIALIKMIQKDEFKDDIQNVKANRNVSSRLAPLNPFLDDLGVLRVGGRLNKSNLNFTSRHPAILPKNCHLTTLLIEHFHKLNLHAGPRLLQGIICQEFWILSVRTVIRSILRKCVKCVRFSKQNSQPLMGELPRSRVVPARCFLRVGVDFGGPVYLKQGQRRNASLIKAYICLFVCMATKAIHLELVSNLSTDAFIAALDRFVSRRGLCEEICSDNGTNFVGANNYLSELYQFLQSPENKAELRRKLAEKKICWNFNPPIAPHFGGIFEAGIKSVKYHLRRAIGDQSLTFEEMTTLLQKIEAILNSRPLCNLSSDVEDIEVLTPAHFLVGGPLLSLPEYDWSKEPRNYLSRWQLLQAISQEFWAKWSLEYLNTLQLRQKWQQGKVPIAENDIVLMKENNTPPLHWPLARVTRVHPGTDDVNRVLTVQRSDGHELQRPAVKLCRLPLDPPPAN